MSDPGDTSDTSDTTTDETDETADPAPDEAIGDSDAAPPDGASDDDANEADIIAASEERGDEFAAALAEVASVEEALGALAALEADEPPGDDDYEFPDEEILGSAADSGFDSPERPEDDDAPPSEMGYPRHPEPTGSPDDSMDSPSGARAEAAFLPPAFEAAHDGSNTRGAFDLVTDTRLVGWAVYGSGDEERQMPSIRVVTGDGTVVAEGVATHFRQDLLDNAISSGWSGFDLPNGLEPSAEPVELTLLVQTDEGWKPTARHFVEGRAETHDLRPPGLLESFAEAGTSGGLVQAGSLRVGSGIWLQVASGLSGRVRATLELVPDPQEHHGDRVAALRVQGLGAASGRVDIRFRLGDHAMSVSSRWLSVDVFGRSGNRQPMRLNLLDHTGRTSLGDFIVPSNRWTSLRVRVPKHACSEPAPDSDVDGFWLELISDANCPVDLVPPTSIPDHVARTFECINVEAQRHIFADTQVVTPSATPFSVVIPFFGNVAYTAACVRAVFSASWGFPEVIVVDDGTPSRSTIDRLLADAGGPVNLVRQAGNNGYTASVNRGVRSATQDVVVILNNDTRPTPGWDQPLLAALLDPDVWSAGPLSNAASYQSVPKTKDGDRWAVNSYPVGVSPEGLAAGLRARFGDRRLKLPLLNGFCYAVRRQEFLDLGGLDEEAFPSGYGEEVDLMLRARSAGRTAVVTPASFVYHYKSITFRADREALSKQGNAILRSRWPRELSAAVKEMDNDPGFDDVRHAVGELLDELVGGIGGH